MVTDSTVGIATESPPREDEGELGVSRNGSPRMIETTMITLTMAMARMIRYVPILSTGAGSD